jgi:hypothetical protein
MNLAAFVFVLAAILGHPFHPLALPAAVPSAGDVPPLEPTFDPAIADYLTVVMTDWPPPAREVAGVPHRAVAESIASVTSDPRDAVLLAGLGYIEGARYAVYVDSLACNDHAWVLSAEGQRLSHYGTCDRGPTDRVGRAHSIWQIHPQDDHASTLHTLCRTEEVDSSREAAARCALAIAKGSLRETGSLAWYTGEWNGEHPKADVRLEFVRRALRKHPPAH